MAVPKATVNKDDFFMTWEDDVRLSWEFAFVKSEPISH
jgi:hypothetical protein